MASGDVLALESLDDEDFDDVLTTSVGKAASPAPTLSPGTSLSSGSAFEGFAASTKAALPAATYAGGGNKPRQLSIRPPTPPLETISATTSVSPSTNTSANTSTAPSEVASRTPSEDQNAPGEKVLLPTAAMIEASYKFGVPISAVAGIVEAVGKEGQALNSARSPGARPSTAGRRISGLFGRARDPSISDAPSDAMMCAKAESHFGGVVDDNRSCKIFGKAVIWLTKEELVIRGTAGEFVWRLDKLTTIQAVKTFNHGEFVIDETSQLGTLLEVQGMCKVPGNAGSSPVGSPAKKDEASRMAAAGAVHVAVRGLGTKEEVESWAGKIKSRKQSASFLDGGS